MKNYTKVILLVIFAIALNNYAFSQYCDFDNNNTTYNQPDFTFSNDCSNYTNYSPINPVQTQIKTINLTFFVIQDDQGGSNFANNTTDLQYLNNIITSANNILANLGTPSPGSSPHIADSRIRFNLLNIYFIPSSQYLNTTNVYSFRNTYIIADQLNLGITNEEKNNSEHIIIGLPNGSVGGRTSKLGAKGYILEGGWYGSIYDTNPYNDNFPYKNLVHEMGHCLGLYHNFHGGPHGNQCDNCNDNDPSPNSCPIEGTSNNIMDYWPGGYTSSHPSFSQCQLSRMHYLLSGGSDVVDLVSEDYCVFNSNNSFDVSTNTVWKNHKTITGNITVKNNSTLTIKCKVRFADASKLIVEPGSELILDGGLLTSACNDYWQGIEVWGNKTQRQLAANQGEIQVINGGTIENAVNAITAGKRVGNSFDWSKTGGIVKLNDANMINNNYDVWFGSYHNFVMVGSEKRNLGNVSSIINSHFENNDNMLPGYEGYAFIGLWDVGRVSINGNKFKNLKTGQTTQQKGRGIVAINSTISVRDYCPSNGSFAPLSIAQVIGSTPCTGAIRNQFEGLYYGIEANSVTGFNNSIIYADRAEFNNVYHGVHILNTKYAVITRSDFSIANNDPAAGSGNTLTDAYGIYLDGSDAYRIEENSFTKDASQQSIRGILVNESGSTDNELYKNYLTDLGYAIQAQGNNRGSGTGLGIYCNEMSGDNSDIVILDDGIAESQKITINTAQNPYFAAGNEFTTCTNNNYPKNYNNTSIGNIIYYADVNNVPQCTYSITFPPYGSSNLPRSCPSKLGSPLTAVLSAKSSAKLAWNSAKTILAIWKDGGNANLEDEVETTQPWDVYVQFNNLLAKSPYLSDDVLLTTIENPAFTSLMIKLLMVANTHASHNPEIMQSIYDRIPAMPEAYIQEIEAGESDVSQLEILEANVAACKHAYTIYTNDAKRIYQMDYEEGDNPSTYISFLTSLNTIESEYELAALYLENDDYDNMSSTLNAISENYTLDEQQTTDLTNWKSYFNIAKTVKQSDITLGMLTESQKAQLESIAELENSPVAHSALSLLLLDNPEYAYYEVVKPVPENNARLSSPVDNSELKIEDKLLKIYPNPSHDYITLEYRTGDKYSSLSIAIKDATGKTVLTKQLKGGNSEEMINLSELKSGVYSLFLYGDATLIEVDKFTILK